MKVGTNLAEIPKNSKCNRLQLLGGSHLAGAVVSTAVIYLFFAVGVGGWRARSWQEDHGQTLQPEDASGCKWRDPVNVGQHPGS